MEAGKNKKCEFCGSLNPASAVKCSLCGRSIRDKRYNLIRYIIAGSLFFALIFIIYIMQQVDYTETGSKFMPGLELISSAGYSYVSGDMIVEGKVKNVSSGILKDVQVVVLWYDKYGNKIARISAPIYLKSILSFQISPFRAVKPFVPQMERYDVSFTTSGGEIIYTRDMREIEKLKQQ